MRGRSGSRSIDWSSGDVERGKAVFTKASCLACHSGSQAMGPGPAGCRRAVLARRPVHRHPAAQQGRVGTVPHHASSTTADDKSYQGLIVYEAVDSVIIQTAQATTVRLGPQTDRRKESITDFTDADRSSRPPAGWRDRGPVCVSAKSQTEVTLILTCGSPRGLIMRHLVTVALLVVIVCGCKCSRRGCLRTGLTSGCSRSPILVVIATATGSTETGEKVKLGWDTEFLGVETTFDVKSVVKGNARRETPGRCFTSKAPWRPVRERPLAG